MKRGVIILPINTLMQRVCPHEFLHGHALVMKKASTCHGISYAPNLSKRAIAVLNRSWSTVSLRREVRCWTYTQWGAMNRIGLIFDDDIDSLRVFDVDSQRTLVEVEQINLLPAHEFPIDKAAIELFRSQWREQFEVRRDNEHIYQQVSKGIWPAGISIGSRCFQPAITDIV